MGEYSDTFLFCVKKFVVAFYLSLVKLKQ